MPQTESKCMDLVKVNTENETTDKTDNMSYEADKVESTNENTDLIADTVDNVGKMKDIKDESETDSAPQSPKQEDKRMPKLLIGSSDPQEQLAPINSPKRHRRTRNSLFAEEETVQEEREIFSIDGSKSIKLPRRRDPVSVFPTGTMGIAPEKDNSSPRRFLTPNEIQERDSGHIDATPHKRPPSARGGLLRNPLTGEGYSDHDFLPMSTFRRRDGNPVLGSGYKTTEPKPAKIPPGGYSKGLW